MNDGTEFVVILARGASSRMGRPKGLLSSAQTNGKTFLETIAGRYAELGLGGVVVTTPELVPSYTDALADLPQFRVVGCAPGGETGRTLWHGWQAAGAEITHLWAHPVDLPLVTLLILQQLQVLAAVYATRVVRPTCLGVPGHPVIIPVSLMTGLASPDIWQQAPMREVIAMARKMGHIEEPVLMLTEDSGVVTDFDRPADIDRA